MKPTLEVYRRRDKQWSWRLKSTNGKIVCTPQRGYPNQERARINASLTAQNFNKRVIKIHFTGSGKAWRWKAIPVTQTTVGPHESFTSKWNAERNLRTALRLFKKAKIRVID